MEGYLIESDGYKYYTKGEGTPLIILHGLMGGLSNFDGVSSYFPTKGYKVLIPELPPSIFRHEKDGDAHRL